jgi:hypothetical protein
MQKQWYKIYVCVILILFSAIGAKNGGQRPRVLCVGRSRGLTSPLLGTRDPCHARTRSPKVSKAMDDITF